MNAIKVDDKQRVRLTALKPGDFYEPEFETPDVITLRRLSPQEERPANVRLVRKKGYSVLVSDRPVNMEAVKDLLADFP